MTADILKQALQICSKPEEHCTKCPLFDAEDDDLNCSAEMKKQALDYIALLEDKNKALIAGQETMAKCIAEKQAEIENYIKVAEYQQNLTLKKSFEIKELKAEIERLEAEIDKQYEQAKADILGNMADGGESCHWCIDGHRKNAIKDVVEKLRKHIEALEYKANTPRKTVPVQTLYDQVNWILKEVIPQTIDGVLKELEGDAE